MSKLIKCPCGRLLCEKLENGIYVFKKQGKEIVRFAHGRVTCQGCDREHIL